MQNLLKDTVGSRVYNDVKTIDMIENNMLGKDGLTITSANHLANIAKEMYEALQSKLEALKLYSRDYMLAINGNTFRVENESEKSDLAAMSESLKEIGDLPGGKGIYQFRQKVASVQGRPVSKTYVTQQFLITIVFPAEETILVRFSGYLMIPEFSPFHDNVIS